MCHNIARAFPLYTDYDPLVPTWCVTPNSDKIIHRFFDTSPFSPSGRYLGLTRLPFEDRLPAPGDVAEIVLVDLATGEERVVAETRGWDTQLGAQVQWGATDTQLFFNDVDTTTWRAFGVVLDPFSGTRRVLDGSVYMVSPDGKWAASPCLLRTGKTQPGYGVIVPQEHVPVNHGASSKDGVYLTDLSTGACKLLVSLQQIVATAIPPMDLEKFKDGDFYSFHVKWNPQGDRLLLVLRWLSHRKDARVKSQVITMKTDGSDIRVAIPASKWRHGGHHPNWCPDSETIMMNLRIRMRKGKILRACSRFTTRVRNLVLKTFETFDDGMRFVRVRYDGSGYRVVTHAVLGSGHPTMHPNGRHVVTDAYPYEPVAFGDGTTPIRLIDLAGPSETTLIRIRTNSLYKGPNQELRVDPHPAWDREFRRIAFNAFANGTRQVYVADLTNVLT